MIRGVDSWTVRAIESNYRVGNITKKESIAKLLDCGMLESDAKQLVRGWFR